MTYLKKQLNQLTRLTPADALVAAAPSALVAVFAAVALVV
jgi:hypothetical protein